MILEFMFGIFTNVFLFVEILVFSSVPFYYLTFQFPSSNSAPKLL